MRRRAVASPISPYCSSRKPETPPGLNAFFHPLPITNSWKSLPLGDASLFLPFLKGITPFPLWDVLGLVCFTLPLGLPCSFWSFWSLTSRGGRDGRWSRANVGTQTRYCFHCCLIFSFFPKLYFSASYSWIKCFLLLNHIMHLPEALLRFSLWGIVCVKTTEKKALQYLFFLSPGRQSPGTQFCILAAKC